MQQENDAVPLNGKSWQFKGVGVYSIYGVTDAYYRLFFYRIGDTLPYKIFRYNDTDNNFMYHEHLDFSRAHQIKLTYEYPTQNLADTTILYFDSDGKVISEYMYVFNSNKMAFDSLRKEHSYDGKGNRILSLRFKLDPPQRADSSFNYRMTYDNNGNIAVLEKYNYQLNAYLKVKSYSYDQMINPFYKYFHGIHPPYDDAFIEGRNNVLEEVHYLEDGVTVQEKIRNNYTYLHNGLPYSNISQSSISSSPNGYTYLYNFK